MPACGHVHRYHGETSYDDGHRHGYDHLTRCSIQVAGGHHVHHYHNQTTFYVDHRHWMRNTTGIDYRVPGGHRHRGSTYTSYNDGHRHYAKFRTSLPR